MALGSHHLITIERHILDHQRDFPGATGALLACYMTSPWRPRSSPARRREPGW